MSKIVTTDAYIWSDVVATSGTPPSARAQHSAVGWIDPSTNTPKMSVFGGTDTGAAGTFYNDVHTLDLVTGNWSGAVAPLGDPPSARYGHSVVGWIDPSTDNPKMSVFGGHDGGGKKNDVHTLDLVTGEWSGAVVTPGAPTARFGHSAVGWIDLSSNAPKMTVFGGYDGSKKNDVHTFDLVTGKWSGAVPTSGDPPSARYAHSAVGWIDLSSNAPKMTVFGGDDGNLKNDVHTLDLVTGKWSVAVAPSLHHPPSARRFHSAVGWIDPSTNEPKMSVFGGNDRSFKNDVHTLDLVTGAWSGAVATSGTPPSARNGHSAVGWIDPITHSIKMSVFGGNGGSYYNDTFTLLLMTMTMPSIRRPKGVVLCGKC